MKRQEFWERLFKWYEKNSRTFPWRQTDNPFHVLIAEFLLQQTHVRKVEDVYNSMTERFPNPVDLLESKTEELREMMKPIGLYYRAERLKKSAQILCEEHGGYVPKDRFSLLQLPGVGSYIADAVLCYGYDQPTVPIDTNVIRVFSRYFGLKSNKSRPRDDKDLAASIREMYDFMDTKHANLVILDFAGLICTANRPKCDSCPLSEDCSHKLKKGGAKDSSDNQS